MKSLSEKTPLWTFTKWVLMSTAVFWAIVYKLSEQNVRLPEFVYVNF